MTTKTRRAPATPTAQDPLFINFAIREGTAPRRMQTRIPTPEQLAVWQSIGEQFTRLGSEWAHQNDAIAHLPADSPEAIGVRTIQGRQAVRGIGRSVKLIKSVLVNEIDCEWVDDAIMDGATIEEMLGIVTKAVDAMRERTKDGITGALPPDAGKTKATLTE